MASPVYMRIRYYAVHIYTSQDTCYENQKLDRGLVMSLRAKGAVTGIGETDYTRNSSKSAFELQIQASLLAIRDAGLDPKDIDGVIPIGLTGAPAEQFVTNFGIPDLRF